MSTMTDDELEDALTREISLRIYTGRIGHFIEGRAFVVHWPAAPDAFLVEAIDRAVNLLIFCRCHSPSQLITIPARFRRRTVIEPFRANYFIALGEGCVFQRFGNIAVRQPPDHQHLIWRLPAW